MKKIIMFLSLIGCLTSCYQDKSAQDYAMINPIIIDTQATEEKFSVFRFETIEITPVVYKEGMEDSNLSFLWTISGNYILTDTIGDKMTLKQTIDYRPYSNPYKVKFKVTDNTTGIFVEKMFDVTVRSPYGTGLVVTDTRDEASGDISLIMASNFQYSLKEDQDTIMRDIFSAVHKRKVEAPINAVLSSKYGSMAASLTIATSQSIERVDPYDYSYMDKNEQLFIVPPKQFNVIDVINDANSGYDIINNDGSIHCRSFQGGSTSYQYAYTVTDNSPYRAGLICKPYWPNGVAFDELNGRILVMDQRYRRLSIIPPHTSNAFAFDGFKDYDCISLSTSSNSIIFAIMRHKQTGEISNFNIKADYSTAGFRATGVIHYNETVCPEIKSATKFASVETGNTLYYIVDNKLYSVDGITLSETITNLEYTAPAGEVITHIYGYSHYRMSGTIKYTNPDPNAAEDKKQITVGSKNRMLVLATYNPTTNEGFIRTIAITNVGTGSLEKDTELHGEFGGFGRITSFSVQQ